MDSKEYFKPICTPYEAELACNANREWTNIYPLDFRQLLPGNYKMFEKIQIIIHELNYVQNTICLLSNVRILVDFHVSVMGLLRNWLLNSKSISVKNRTPFHNQ